MSEALWRRFFQDLDAYLSSETRSILRSLALRTRQGIEALDPLMTRYCADTCPQCEDVCCTAARVAYNITDMAYLMGLELALPIGQTRLHKGDPCRYWLPSGCALPRYLRPYVCTWFFCEAHMQLFFMEPPKFQRHILSILQDVHGLREAIYQTVRPYLSILHFEESL
ncbi:MAG: hypothetical protein WHS46_04700 [Desulfosoma sp.]